jgi:two-component system LytT family sensor kinase
MKRFRRFFGAVKRRFIRFAGKAHRTSLPKSLFLPMTAKLPLGRLIRMGWTFSFLGSLLTTITNSAERDGWSVTGMFWNCVGDFYIFICLFYINIGVRLLFKDRYAWPRLIEKFLGVSMTCVLGTVVFYSIHLIEPFLAERQWIVVGARPTHTLLYELMRDFLQALGVGLLVSLWNGRIIAQQNKTETEIENAQLKLQHSQAEYRLLKQQIHPHFLFNALSILKSLIRSSPDLAEEYLIHLSGFLRAAVSSDKNTTTALSEEVELCLDYLAMQKIRFGESLHYSIDIEPEALRKGALLSFSLLPLVENAIKHNEATIEAPLYIRIGQENDHIKVSNNIQLKRYKESSTGVGLSNLSGRYQLWSGDDVFIREEDQGRTFSVSIKIVQHANSHHRRRSDHGR